MDNPSAFPAPDERANDGSGIREGSSGMTLLDYFAGQALVEIVSRPLIHGLSTLHPNSPMHPDKAATLAYWYAEAMLAERQKRNAK